MKRRHYAVLVLPAALLLAACTSSAGDQPAATSSPVPGTSSAPVPSTPAGTPANAAELAALLQRGVSGIRTAHVEFALGVSGQSITGSGQEKLHNGKAVAVRLTEDIGTGSVEVIIADGKTYAKLPGKPSTAGKPYVLISPDSKNAQIRALATIVDSAQSSASLDLVKQFANAASSVRVLGSQRVAGVPTTHYKLVVDASELPADYPGKSALHKAGIATLPLDLYVDGQGRPVQVVENITYQGRQITVKLVIDKYDQPVTITAPPANRVSTG